MEQVAFQTAGLARHSPDNRGAEPAAWYHCSVKYLLFPLCIICASIYLFIQMHPIRPKSSFCCLSPMRGAVASNGERSTHPQPSETEACVQGHGLVLGIWMPCTRSTPATILLLPRHTRSFSTYFKASVLLQRYVLIGQVAGPFPNKAQKMDRCNAFLRLS